jgi:hypothetical protein
MANLPTQEEVQQVIRRIQALENENDQLRQHAAALDEQNRNLRANTPPAVSPMIATPAEKPLPPLPCLPRLALPERFDGNRNRFRGFINACDLLFSSRPDYYDDRNKVITVGSLLSGTALEWFNPLLEKPKEYEKYLNSYSQFKKLLTDNFGIINAQSVAFHRLKQLKQGHGPASSYGAAFRSCASDLNWDQSALIQHFEDGLDPEVKKLVLFSPASASLDDAIALAIRVDQKLFQIRQDSGRNRGSERPSFPSFIPPAHVAPSSSDGPTPMEIDQARREPLSADERQRRLVEGRCLVCGKEGHMKKSCPLAYANRQGNVKDQ